MGNYMILVTIRIQAPQESHQELTQTIQTLLSSIRNQNGCLDASLGSDTCPKGCNQAAIYLTEEWETQADADAHLQSNDYAILLGAISVLRGQSEVEFKEQW